MAEFSAYDSIAPREQFYGICMAAKVNLDRRKHANLYMPIDLSSGEVELL